MIPKVITAMSVRKYIIVPQLKGRPIVFTKNSSKVEIKLIAPGIITPCTKPKIAIEIKNAIIGPDAPGALI